MFDLEKIAKAIAEAPAKILDKTIEVIIKDEKTLMKRLPFRKAEEYIDVLGPGLVTGAADDDPSGIATYSQTGAQYGFQLIWLALFTFPFMAMVQEMCARIGIVTGRGLAGNIKHNYSKKILFENKNWEIKNLETEMFLASEKFNKEKNYPEKNKGYLLRPLRVALSGKQSSPSPFEIADILGKEETIKKIDDAINMLG